MSSAYQSEAATQGQTVETARSLQQLYFIRVGFSVTWAILISVFTKTEPGIAAILLIIYPAWDVIGTAFPQH
ncbi:MAG TPA: hypothetical protein VGN00_22055 [Puia sp.]|jgi:hypothetical protein